MRAGVSQRCRAINDYPRRADVNEYHKIQTVFKRDPATNHKTLLEGKFSLPEFEYLECNEWSFTEKVDGTNIRVTSKDGKLVIGGRTDRAQIPATLVEALSCMFLPAQLAEVFPDSEYCLYGEGYGAKIQKGGGNYRLDQSFVLFDVQVGEWWLRREDVEDVAEQLGIDIVPEIGRGNLGEMIRMARDGFVSRWGDFPAEGIVARPMTELRTRAGYRVITKVKVKDFA